MEQIQNSSESTESLKSELKDREEIIKNLQITLQQQDNFIIQLKQQIKNQSNQSKSSNNSSNNRGNNDLNEEIRMLEIKLIESHKINDKYVENIQELNKKYDYERLKNNSLENELNTAIKKLGENLNVFYFYLFIYLLE